MVSQGLSPAGSITPIFPRRVRFHKKLKIYFYSLCCHYAVSLLGCTKCRIYNGFAGLVPKVFSEGFALSRPPRANSLRNDRFGYTVLCATFGLEQAKVSPATFGCGANWLFALETSTRRRSPFSSRKAWSAKRNEMFRSVAGEYFPPAKESEVMSSRSRYHLPSPLSTLTRT